ncbi:hypothetical protein NC651_038333 [Populus alba x Populus x berolinensis]|nr:hypothetical protein NC651_038333 [Populus alba x Populus x berolinensis]
MGETDGQLDGKDGCMEDTWIPLRKQTTNQAPTVEATTAFQEFVSKLVSEQDYPGSIAEGTRVSQLLETVASMKQQQEEQQ